MAMCERCWTDAWLMAIAHPELTQTQHYLRLIEQRSDHHCSALEQATGRRETNDDDKD